MKLRSYGISAAFLLALGPGAYGQEGPFRGKTLTITIGYAQAGNSDVIGRLVARHLPKHLPGNPVGIASNMPGAGSLRAANFLFNQAPRDGSSLAILTPTVGIDEALGVPAVQYRARDFTWIGRVAVVLQPIAAFAHSQVRSFADLYKVDMPVASTGVVSPSDAYPRLLNGVLGTKFKTVTGYTSSNDSLLAMERKEVDGGLVSWNTLKLTKASEIDRGEIRPLVQFTLARSKDLPDTPTSVEVGRTEEEKDILRFYTAAEDIGRSILGPPGMPPERIIMMRKAFGEMMGDPEFLEEVRRLQLEFAPLSGSELEKLARSTTDVSAKTIAGAKRVMTAP